MCQKNSAQVDGGQATLYSVFNLRARNPDEEENTCNESGNIRISCHETLCQLFDDISSQSV